MRVIVVHNFYRQPGGEDTVFRSECQMLRSAGIEIETYSRSNWEPGAKLGLFWSHKTVRELRQLAKRFRPDVMHVHNSFFTLSPSVNWALDVPIVQTLHNLRRIDCRRDSFIESSALAMSYRLHQTLGTWRRITTYIAPSRFVRDAHAAHGIGPITVKPHFVSCRPQRRSGRGDYVLFAGRICQDKGVTTLAAAWNMLKSPPPLVIAGSGPMEDVAKRIPQSRLLGWIDREALWKVIRNARFVVVPSEFQEPFGMAVIEAYACGVPVVVSDSGALPELVENGVTGHIFHSAQPAELADKVASMWDNSESHGRAAYECFLSRYTAERNLQQLLGVYEQSCMRRPHAI